MNGLRASTILLLSLPLTASVARSQEPEDPVAAVGGGSWEINAEVLRATDRGLAYLAKRQESNGAWLGDVGFKVNSAYNVTKSDVTHVGVSALAVMAFLANGELPGKGKYGTVVEKAVDYLVSCANENGYIEKHGTRMYSHAFATLALAEVYGMTERKDVRAALQRSVDLISQCQNREGGWRYKPFAQESDMSITVCQVMALRAARNSGVFVPRNVIEDAVKYVRGSARGRSQRRFRPRYFPHRRGWRNDGVFRYQKRIDARASFSLTAAGVTTLYGAGVYEDPLIDRGLDYLENNLADFNRNWESHYFFFYGNYYAVQAFFIAGGRRWDKYFREIREVLLDRQRNGGYWTCDTGPGREFATAVAVLILSIPYRYLPIFQR
ncbi:MAG: prenyltransferase/squalene oxidase repeat-containing protein [Planctomycetota bacterium]